MRRIEADGLLEGLQGLGVMLLPPQVAALEVAAVGLEVVGPRSSLNGSNSRSEPGLDCVDNARGDLVLNGEDVGRLPVEALGPELVAARDVGQLRGDAQPGPRRPNAALEDVAHGQRAGDCGQITCVLARSEGRRP